MTITSAEVQHIAKLAKLSFNEEELAKMAKELDAIVAYVEQLKELELDEVLPTSHVLDLSNVLREDEVEPALPVEEVLRNAPSRKNSYFSVPKVIG
ncbi:MAG: Asp-tRNA(Asn)/Glu-tRNA(Gln) amidotransferase subunit GatC [bacterium]